MPNAILQPTTISTPPEQLRTQFVKISSTHNPDPLWHFELALPKTARSAPPQKETPQPGGPLISLALFNRPDPSCDIEIMGMLLSVEINPADWLDIWLERQPFVVLSRLRHPTISGAVGDVVVQWQTDGVAFMGRLFALKAGPRFFLLWFRTRAEDYAANAEAIFLSLSTFKVLDERTGPLAEQIRWIGAEHPFKWRTAIPASWEVTEEPATNRAASFQATLFTPSPTAGEPPLMLGKLSFAVIAAPEVKEPAELFQKMFAAINEAGINVPVPAAADEPVTPQYTQGWHCETAATVNGMPAEVGARVLRHAKGWIAALIISPPRDKFPDQWMRNTRLLDISLGTLEIS